MDALLSLSLNEDRYVSLLSKLISEVEFLQNNPPNLLPQEDRAIAHILSFLRPHSEAGTLSVEKVGFVHGRSNVIVRYPATGGPAKTVAFVGSHLDVVPATPETWNFPPFQLTRHEDQLRGRGTTDCLGHVALLCEFFFQLAESKPNLPVSVVGVFIASEEATSVPPNAGVEWLVENGKLDFIKNGPVFWVDCSDSQPCIGTAGAIQWHLKAKGKLFHSGLPHKGINSLELGMEALAKIQERFYRDFPAHPNEAKYNFATPSTMKPTQVECAKGGLNQIPPWTTISGDIRLTPFYNVPDVMAKVESYVKELNEQVEKLPVRGPCSKFVLPDLRGSLELTWGSHPMSGIACNLDSPGYKALVNATKEVIGKVEPYAICGSLPLVREMQAAGFDIQLCGYGKSSVYHADNEYCLLSDMKAAFQIFTRVVKGVSSSA